MERIVGRFRNLTILGVVLFAQVVGLAVQIRRPGSDGSSARLLRVWSASAVTPLERAVVGAQQGLSYGWHNYFYLRGVRTENEGLRLQIDQLRLQQARLREDAAQAHRLQALLAFKEQFVSTTIAAQVIGTSGSEHSRLITIDKGANDGIHADNAVVTPDGVVGKVIRADKTTSQVLLINDEQGGVGALLEKSRLQGIVRGTPSGTLILHNIMNDEKIEPGEVVMASGGDRVFPKGMPIGRVKNVRNGADVFYDIEVTPSADLSRLEEVLVITRLVEKAPDVETAGPVRAADMLAERLPTVPPPPPTGPDGKPLPANAAGATNGSAGAVKTGSTAPPAAGGVNKPTPPAGTASPKTTAPGANGAPTAAKPDASGANATVVPKTPAAGTATTAQPNAQGTTTGTTAKPAVKKTTVPPADQHAEQANPPAAVPEAKKPEVRKPQPAEPPASEPPPPLQQGGVR